MNWLGWNEIGKKEKAMKVKDLIVKLQKMPQDVPVCLYDWGEEYYTPTETEAEKVVYLKNAKYIPKDKAVAMGDIVLIGGWTAN